MPIVKQPLPAFNNTIVSPNPVWQTASGNLSIEQEYGDMNIQLDATEPFGGDLTYSFVSGSLPGRSLVFENGVCLFHGDENSGSTVATNSVTSVGFPMSSGMVITNTESKFGTGCIDNQNKSGYMTLGRVSTNLGITNQDFSIHGWFNRKGNPASNPSQAFYIMCSNFNHFNGNDFSITMYMDSAARPIFSLRMSNNVTYTISDTQVIPLNAWTHVALVKQNNIMYAFINGRLLGTRTMGSITLNNPTNPLYLCASNYQSSVWNQSQTRFNGRIDEFVIETEARWTGDFIPPTAPFNAGGEEFINDTIKLQLSFDDDLVDQSYINHMPDTFTGTYETGKFNSGIRCISGQMLRYLDSENNFQFNTDDMTIEGYIKQDNNRPNGIIMSSSNYQSTGNGWAIEVNNSEIGFTLTSNSSVVATLGFNNNTIINNDNWYHWAICRTGNIFKLFIDGELKEQITNTISLNNTGGIYIGHNPQSINDWFDGTQDEIRIHNGIAKYVYSFELDNLPYPSPSNDGVMISENGLLSGSVGSFVDSGTGSITYDFVARVTSNLTNISEDRSFSIVVLDPAFSGEWTRTFNGESTPYIINFPNEAQFNNDQENSVWLQWNGT